MCKKTLHRFPKSLRLRKRHQFRQMSHDCERLVGKWIILDIRHNQTEITRLGITVTKRFGPSHERNRFKRIVREAFRLNYPHLSKGFDLNVKPRSCSKQAKTSDIASDLIQLLPLSMSVPTSYYP